MRLAEQSVRKRNAEGEEYGGGGLCFCPSAEGVSAFLRENPVGKVLFVADLAAYPVFLPFVRSRRAISLVYDGDALSLFAMPDEVSCILAAGGEEVLAAARYFAGVRRVSCALFPISGTLFGAVEPWGEVTIGKECERVPLCSGKLYFDERRAFSPTEAYCALMLFRLAQIERAALAAFRGEPYEIPPVTAYPYERRALILENWKLRRTEEQEFLGEGRLLCRRLAKRGFARPAYYAFVELSALYSAFFKRGFARRYFTPDYGKRAKAAGVQYGSLVLPTPAEYAQRAVVLERIRAEFLTAIEALIAVWRKSPFFLKTKLRSDLTYLKRLPELGGGLTAIIRDCGLLE